MWGRWQFSPNWPINSLPTISIPRGFWRYQDADFNTHVERQRTQISQNKVENRTILENLHHRTSRLTMTLQYPKQCGTGIRIHTYISETKKFKTILTFTWSRIFHKSGRVIQWEKDTVFLINDSKTPKYLGRNESRTLPHTTQAI